MDYLLKYDDSDPISIESYAKRLIGQTFKDVLYNSKSEVREEMASIYDNKKYKGSLGNLLEEYYFGYKPNSSPKPDFPKAGVELKATPYEKNKNGKLRAGERLVLGMISYENPIEDDFYDSHAWQKCQLTLLIYYLRNKSLPSKLDNTIDYVSLFTPPQEDLEIIENDYKIIAEKIKAGRAHELSEGDTMYLGACTKGETAIKSTVPQFYGSHEVARKRAFCFKTSYMTYVLNNYIVNNVRTYESAESILQNADKRVGESFQDFIVRSINRYVGKTDKELCELLERPYNDKKNLWIDLAYRMLGIKSNKAEEFIKANITVKAIRIESNGKMKESSPLPTFKYKEIIEEEWEDSTLYNYFEETKFLYVVYKKEGETYTLRGCKLWNMPSADLNNIVREGWQSVVDVIKDGVVLERKYTKKGIEITNNFPSKKANRIVHVRPHASHRFYELENGEIIGEEENRIYANQLPDGRWMANFSFWINNDYILEQVCSGL